MIRKKKSFLLPGFAILLSLLIAGCSGGSAGSGSLKTYTLSGTLNKANVNGVYAYLKLVAPGGAAADKALYWAKSSQFALGAATCAVANIAEGRYTGYAFIDANRTAAGDGTSMPDAGDYATSGGKDFTIDSDQAFDLSDKNKSWTMVSKTGK